MKRRDFLRHTALAGLIAGLPAMGAPPQALAGSVAVNPALEATRQALLTAMEARRKETRMRVTREEAQFLQLMVYLIQARSVLELGTFHAYSSIWMATALEQTGGKLTTVEIDPERVKIAKNHLTQAGLGERVECLEGDAHKVAKTLAGPFDLVLIDADKDRCDDYFNTLYPKLQPGGVILLNHVAEFQDLMGNYLTLVRQHPRLISLVVGLTAPSAFSVSYHRR